MTTPLSARSLLLSLCMLAGAGAAAPPALAQAGAPGQVGAAGAAKVTRYAAARLAEQATFGATPAVVDQIRQLGMEAWLEQQFELPVSQIALDSIEQYDDQDKLEQQRAYDFASNELLSAMLTGADQLRLRVSWAISQYVTVSSGKVQPYGALAYANFLQRQAFGNYTDFIRLLSRDPSMGVYLDNLSNLPTSTDCPDCQPNENYARELMQLFTIGVVRLDAAGGTLRDDQGRPLETYTQADVEQLARALTGWRMDGDYPRGDFRGYKVPLVANPWRGAHDRGAKLVLGTEFPAGREPEQELETIAATLGAHPNIAPFVSLRLIQHLVTSAPTPAYLRRVADVYRDNGAGVAGDLRAVVKAILLDPEARRGDVVGADTSGFGKIREPMLWYTAALRGLGCEAPLHWESGAGQNSPAAPSNQQPYNATSVFSFYLPTDRAPGSNRLSPEQRLLTSEELSARFGGYSFNSAAQLATSGCDADTFGRALGSSPRAYAELLNQRYFRGAMPAALRQNLIDLAPSVYGDTPNQKAITLLLYALATPYFGAMR